MTALPHPELEPRRISQRELRNNSAQIMRDLEAGESFILTNNGREVGRVVPITEPALQPAVPRHPRFRERLDEIVPVTSPLTIQEVLDDLRDDRL